MKTAHQIRLSFKQVWGRKSDKEKASNQSTSSSTEKLIYVYMLISLCKNPSGRKIDYLPDFTIYDVTILPQ